MTSTRDKGAKAEALAAAFLEKQGLKILARNWHTPRGELDIVAREGDELRIVEVRSRHKDSPYVPEASLSRQKSARLFAVAQRFRQKFRLPHVPIRLDLLVVDLSTGEIKYYPGGISPPASL